MGRGQRQVQSLGKSYKVRDEIHVAVLSLSSSPNVSLTGVDFATASSKRLFILVFYIQSQMILFLVSVRRCLQWTWIPKNHDDFSFCRGVALYGSIAGRNGRRREGWIRTCMRHGNVRLSRCRKSPPVLSREPHKALRMRRSDGS